MIYLLRMYWHTRRKHFGLLGQANVPLVAQTPTQHVNRERQTHINISVVRRRVLGRGTKVWYRIRGDCAPSFIFVYFSPVTLHTSSPDQAIVQTLFLYRRMLYRKRGCKRFFHLSVLSVLEMRQYRPAQVVTIFTSTASDILPVEKLICPQSVYRERERHSVLLFVCQFVHSKRLCFYCEQ